MKLEAHVTQCCSFRRIQRAPKHSCTHSLSLSLFYNFSLSLSPCLSLSLSLSLSPCLSLSHILGASPRINPNAMHGHRRSEGRRLSAQAVLVVFEHYLAVPPASWSVHGQQGMAFVLWDGGLSKCGRSLRIGGFDPTTRVALSQRAYPGPRMIPRTSIPHVS